MQSQLEETLANLVSIPSTSHNLAACHEIVSLIRTELESHGFFIHEAINSTSPWLLATTKDTKEPTILLTAHLDVVPAPDDMFTMRKQDGKLYGRGVFDMKLAAACYLEFVRTHRKSLRDMNIGLLFTTDEETNSASMREAMDTGLKPNVALLPDGGENWQIEERAKGMRTSRIIAKGKAAHGSRPWEGHNALHQLIDVVQLLRARYPSDTQSGATLMVNQLKAGEASNQLPDHASALIDFRTFDNQELVEHSQFLDTISRTHNVEIELITSSLPTHFDKTSPAVQGFLQVLAQQRHLDTIPYSDSYGQSDARFFVKKEIPCILIEPHGGGRHSVDEWIEADDLSAFYRLIEAWILKESKIGN